MHRTLIARALVAATISTALLAACGSDDKDAVDTSTTASTAVPATTAAPTTALATTAAETTEPATTESETTEPDTTEPETTEPESTEPESTEPETTAVSAPETIDVTAVDYNFDGIPKTIAAGSTLSLTNKSTAEVHELVAFRLPDTETRDAATLAALPREELEAVLAGPPALVTVAPPTQAGFTAVGDGTLSVPGRYLLLCTIPTGANPADYLAAAQAAHGGPVDVAGGAPHFVIGMFAETTVE
jgi:hypothetical protein